MKNILLVGEWQSMNLGDKILCNCCYKYLNSNVQDCNFIKFDLSHSNRGEKLLNKIYTLTESAYGYIYRICDRNSSTRILALSKMRSKIFTARDLKRLPTIDCIIFCGGQIFLHYFTYGVYEIVKYAERNNIPLIWNACGGSDWEGRCAKILTRCINSSVVKSLTVRDNIKFFKRINSNAKLVPDTALLASDFYKVESKETVDVGLGVMGYDTIKYTLHGRVSKMEVIAFWRNLVSNIEKAGLRWKFFTNGSPEDYNFAQEVLSELSSANTNICEHICPRPETESQLVELIAQFKRIISFRLHSHIIAYSLAIPSYGLAWDKKVVDFFALTKCPNQCSEYGVFDVDKAFNFITSYGRSKFDTPLKEVVIKHMQDDVIKHICSN